MLKVFLFCVFQSSRHPLFLNSLCFLTVNFRAWKTMPERCSRSFLKLWNRNGAKGHFTVLVFTSAQKNTSQIYVISQTVDRKKWNHIVCWCHNIRKSEQRKCNLFGGNQVQNLISESAVLFHFIKACDKFCVRVNASRSSSRLLTGCPARVNPRPLFSLTIGQQELMHSNVNSLILGICKVLCSGTEVNLVQMKDLNCLQGLQVSLYSFVSLTQPTSGMKGFFVNLWSAPVGDGDYQQCHQLWNKNHCSLKITWMESRLWLFWGVWSLSWSADASLHWHLLPGRPDNLIFFYTLFGLDIMCGITGLLVRVSCCI